jgi:hypothetical protein
MASDAANAAKPPSQQQSQNLERGSDCLIRDAQRIVTLSATEKFDGEDGVIDALLPFHIYGRQSQLDNDYSFAMNLSASESSTPRVPGSQQRALRRVMASRTEVFEAQMLRKAGIVRKKLGRLRRRIDGLEKRNNQAAYCELMLHVSDASSREFAARQKKEREEKRKQQEKIAEEERLKAEREERLRAERERWRAEEAAAKAAAAAGVPQNLPHKLHQPQHVAVAVPGGPAGVAVPIVQEKMKTTGSLKLKLSMKKDAPGAAPQSLRAGSGANFLTSPAGQASLSLASHNPQMSGDASRMSPGVTDGATLVDSRAMSLEIETGSKRDEYDDVVSSGQVAKDVPPIASAPAVATRPAAQAPPAGPASKPQISGKFKLMKLMKKKK